MEEQKKKNNVVTNIWNNWCRLDPAQRHLVAERLGPLGHALSIAANVSEFARHAHSPAEDAVKVDADEDIIDVEFEECDP